MSTLYQIKEYGYRRLSRQSDEVRQANIQALTYIERIAAHSQTNISHWDVQEVFGTGKGLHFVTDPAILNQKFFAEKSKRESEVSEDARQKIGEIDQVVQENFRRVIHSVQMNLQSDITSCSNEIARHYRSIDDERTHLIKKQLALIRLQGRELDLAGILTGVEKDGFFKIASFNSSNIRFVTVSDIILGEKNPAANLNYQVNLGTFIVSIQLSNLQVRVTGGERNILSRGYIHPHISASGDICFGRIQSQASDYLHSFQIGEFMKLLAALLSSYSNNNPFHQLVLFKEEYDRKLQEEMEKKSPKIDNDMPF